MSHLCHWPGCQKVVPPNMWGCTAHWFALPMNLRAKIWANYRTGQEITKKPSTGYINAAKEAQAWIKEREALK